MLLYARSLSLTLLELLQHFVKDMSIALEEAQRMQLALPGLALAQQLYTALVAQGQHFNFPWPYFLLITS